jgi:hypothetical protein
MIGSLSHLIREAAILAILDGSEQITTTTLDDIALDHAAEQHRATLPPQRPPALQPGEVA